MRRQSRLFSVAVGFRARISSIFQREPSIENISVSSGAEAEAKYNTKL